jgi:hypothetical protein
MRTHLIFIGLLSWMLLGCKSPTHDPYDAVYYPPPVYDSLGNVHFPPSKRPSVSPAGPIVQTSGPVLTVCGNLSNPGFYDWTNGMTLNDIVKKAGGFKKDFGSGPLYIRHVDGSVDGYVLKPGWELMSDPDLRPGDRLLDPADRF